jgi:hypothetical protein
MWFWLWLWIYAIWCMKRLPLSLHYNDSYKRMVMGHVNCKNFRMFYIVHKVTNTPCLAWSQYYKGATLSALPFKATHLSKHQCWLVQFREERTMAVCHTSFLWIVWNILKRIHILVDLRISWVSGSPALLTTILFYDRGSFHRRVVPMWWKYLNLVRKRFRSHEE